MDQDIKQILNNADSYLKRLQNLQNDVNFAQEQIKQSAQEAEIAITESMEAAITNVTVTLTERRNAMLKKLKERQLEGLMELDHKLLDLVCRINEVKNVISIGKNLLTFGNESPSSFLNQSELLKTVPLVPSLFDIPYFTFERSANFEQDLNLLCQNFGSIAISGPAQITSLTPRPGGVLVEWEISDKHKEHNLYDFDFFHLQNVEGDIRSDPDKMGQFQTVYVGKENHALVLNLKIGQLYTFRVCCKADVEGFWSAWSVLRTAATNLEPYRWAPNEHYHIEGKFASPLRTNVHMLYSNLNKFYEGYSIKIEFRRVQDESHELSEGTFVGLYADNTQGEFTTINPHSIVVEATGHIYVQGVKKSTKFPQLHAGNVVTFTCELQEKNKIRVNIDLKDKRVTYDWPIDGSAIYVGAILKNENWRIALE